MNSLYKFNKITDLLTKDVEICYHEYNNYKNKIFRWEIMNNKELQRIKEEIEKVRQEIHTYMEYPEIFEIEINEASKKIDQLINEYMKLSVEK